MDMEYEVVHVVGTTGGLLTMWRKTYFVVIGVSKSLMSIILQVQFSNSADPLWIVNVYGLNVDEERIEFFLEQACEQEPQVHYT